MGTLTLECLVCRGKQLLAPTEPQQGVASDVKEQTVVFSLMHSVRQLFMAANPILFQIKLSLGGLRLCGDVF